MILVVHREQVVEHLHVAVVGEAEVAYAAGLALLDEIVEHAVVHIAGVEGFHAAAADAVQQVVVDVVYLQLFHRVVVHLDGAGAGLGLRTEVGELGGHEVAAARMAVQGDAGATLGETAGVGGGGVEIVHTVLDGIVHLLVDHLLVVFFLAGYLGQTHHAVAQERHFLLGLGVHTVGHLAHRGLHLLLVFGLSRRLGLLAAAHCGGGGHRADAEELEEVAAAEGFSLVFFHFSFGGLSPFHHTSLCTS